ncbi:hypothetical protein [Brachybacterium sp. ACRRE]|uniref:hypothetical protein n=1 Tax=Brachybacterium sp. ACRRE TaxID=2918184 RepID=UPI001EF3533C|nr:hypothetical protein [Brachybacterium sp. ACRRE]MCG7309423.1 hypothetical protein [Brachybacterium sp. ACRRE]
MPVYAPAGTPDRSRLTRTFAIIVITLGALFLLIRSIAIIVTTVGGYSAGYQGSEAAVTGFAVGGVLLVILNVIVGIALLAAAIYFLVVGPQKVRIGGGLILAPLVCGVVTRLIITAIAQAALQSALHDGSFDAARGLLVVMVIVEVIRHVIEGAFVIVGGIVVLRAAKKS